MTVYAYKVCRHELNSVGSGATITAIVTAVRQDRLPQWQRIAGNSASVEMNRMTIPTRDACRQGCCETDLPQRQRIAGNAASVERNRTRNPYQKHLPGELLQDRLAATAANRGKRCQCGREIDWGTGKRPRNGLQKVNTGTNSYLPIWVHLLRRSSCRCVPESMYGVFWRYSLSQVPGRDGKMVHLRNTDNFQKII